GLALGRARPGGGIGRRAGFRCQWCKSRGGSSPLLGTSLRASRYGSASQRSFCARLSRRSPIGRRRTSAPADRAPSPRASREGAMWYVYILESLSDPGRFYTGVTTDLRARFRKHNSGRVPHTSKHVPWRTKTYVAFSDEAQAYIFEQYLKTASGRAFA